MAHTYMLTMASFKGWLQDTDVEAAPCTGERCILAEWLKSEGFNEPEVDSELICERNAPDIDEPLRMTPTPWMLAVITAFDAMAPEPHRLHCAPYKSIGPEVYKAPLLSLLDSILAAEKAAKAAQDAIEQTSLNASTETP